jgi:uncharacterized membrane protein
MVIMQIKRLFQHLLFPDRKLQHAFPADSRTSIEAAITQSEQQHAGELRFVVEASLDLKSLLQNKTAQTRALEVFSELHVWDTENNNGVLIYLLLAEKSVEIIADRGIAKKVSQLEWEDICHQMESAFAKQAYLNGTLEAINSISIILQKYFPKTHPSTNELCDKPVFLKS